MPLTTDDIAQAYARYRQPILAYCVGRLGSLDAAEDAAGATWEEFVRRAPTYEDRGHPVSALLYRIALSRCVDHVRRARRKPTEPLSPRLVAAAPDVEAALDARALVAARLARLQPRHARVLLLSAEGWSDREIGAQLGISACAAKALLWRARHNVMMQTGGEQ